MNEQQQHILDDIRSLKAQLPTVHKSDRERIMRQLKKLAHWLTEDDDRTHDLKYGRKSDPGGRSRSPSFGRWRQE